MSKIEKEILTTRGVTSKVAGLNMGLFDFDTGISKSKVLNECMDLDGINILWRSSKTGYHLWNLAIRPIKEIAMLGLEMGADCKHVQSGVHKGRWVLRISPKWHNGEIYKEEPKLLHTFCNPSSKYHSIPHLQLFKALTGKTPCNTDNYTWVGQSADIEVYRTFTDKMKMRLENDAKTN